jgi:hypothetical protein
MKQKSGPDKAPAEQVLKNIRRQKVKEPDIYPGAHNGLVAGCNVADNQRIQKLISHCLCSGGTFAPALRSNSQAVVGEDPQLSEANRNVSAIFLFFALASQSYDAHLTTISMRHQ